MKSYIIDTMMGLFAIDNSGNLINYQDFKEKEEEVIEFYDNLDQGILGNKYVNLIRELKASGFRDFTFENEQLYNLSTKNFDINTNLAPNSKEIKSFRFNLRNQLKGIGLSMTQKEMTLKYKDMSEKIIREKIKDVGEKLYVQIIQITETLDMLKDTISKFSSRLREWYGLHFPELTDKIIEENITLGRLVSEIGHRKNFHKEILLEKMEFREHQIDMILEIANKSMGTDMDLENIQNFASEICAMDAYREDLEKDLEVLMENVAPNIKAIIGSLIGAKLIAKAGSLHKLAFMPSSRIQLLGAETALYRHLKTGNKLPKHGIIFQWQQIRGNPPWIRGNIARIISGKLALAAKIDYFGGDFIGDEYAQEIEEKIEELKEKYAEPSKTDSKERDKTKRWKK